MRKDAGAGAGRPSVAEQLDIRVAEVRQLFDAMDEAPFRKRDLDPKVVEFVVDWARELPGDAVPALTVHVSTPVPAAAGGILGEAVRDYFSMRSAQTRRHLRRLFRTGRIALVVGLLFVAAANVIGDMVGSLIGRYNYGRLIQESFAIGAWVALWRPLEIFLYNWWPVRAEARLFDRLADMRVNIVHDAAAPLVDAED